MKNLVIFFSFILFSLNGFTQTTEDSTTISNIELNKVFSAYRHIGRTRQYKNSFNKRPKQSNKIIPNTITTR